VLAAVTFSLGLAAGNAYAQNALYQSYFFGVCSGAPTGSLATRCAETPGGTGDLSGDSESSLNPSQFVSSNEAAIVRARARSREISDYLEGRRDAEASGSPVPEGLSLLLNGRRTVFERDRTTEERGFDGFVHGFQIGGDYRVNEGSVVGVFLGYARSDSEFDRDAPGVAFTPLTDDGSSNSETYAVTAFGTVDLGNSLSLDGSVGYGWTAYDFKRRAIFQESGRAVPQTNVRTKSSPDGGELTADVGLSWEMRRDQLAFGAYVRGTWARTWIESYRERDSTGSGLGMSVDRQTRESLTSTLGLRARHSTSTRVGVIVPQVRIEYVHEFDREEQDADPRLLLDAAGNVFSLEGDGPDENYFQAGVGVALVLKNGWMPFADYQALIGYDDFTRYTVTLGLRKEF
jgi:outer membrane autotransporter protein